MDWQAALEHLGLFPVDAQNNYSSSSLFMKHKKNVITVKKRTLSDLDRFLFDNLASIGFVSHSFGGGGFGAVPLFFFNRDFRTLPVGVKLVGILIFVIGSG